MKSAECGTRSGYNRHKRLNTEVCNECKNAQNSYDRNRYKNNPDYFKLKNKRNLNKEKKLARWRKREALRLGGKHENYSLKDILDKYGEICHICNKKIDLSLPRKCGQIGWEYSLHLDHVIPLSLGGDDTINNVKPSHALCNLKKQTRLRYASI
jgi:hypothetical protein